MAILRPKSLCQCHLELEETIGLSSFDLGQLSSSKNFGHIIKDASVFHLKLAIAIGLTIFRHSPLQNTPFITTTNLSQIINFLYVNMADLSQLVDYEHEILFPATLNQLDVLSFLPFS